MTYLSDKLSNPAKLPFIELFKEIYKGGLLFANNHPREAKIGILLMAQRDDIFDKVMKDGLDIAKQTYIGLIQQDQERGNINKSVNPAVLSELLISMSMNIIYDEQFITDGHVVSEEILKRVDEVCNILEKGLIGK